MTWIVIIHDGGGSMVEAADPRFVATVVDEKTAAELAGVINNEFSRKRMHDWWCNYWEAPQINDYRLPKASAAQMAANGQPGPIPPRHFALDVSTLVEQIQEGLVERLPPEPEPVAPGDIDAAIRSITNGDPT